MKAELKDRALKALKPEKKPYDVMDAQRAFGVRVMPSGEKTFILYRRFPGSPSPVRRSLGQYGELTLSEAREKAYPRGQAAPGGRYRGGAGPVAR